MVIVYTNSNCVQCEQTKRYLTLNEIPFEVKDLASSEEALDLAADKGYRSAPIVVAGDDSWSGFRLEKLAALKETK